MAWPWSLAVLDRPLIGRSGRVRLIASALWALVLGFALVSAAHDPIVAAADVGQYNRLESPLFQCFDDLAGPRPACPYVKPAITGMDLPSVKEARDPARIAAAVLSGDGRGLTGIADQLLSLEHDGLWLYTDEVPLRHSTLRPPWASASAQGLAISVLARAWTVTSDTRYRDGLMAAALAMPTSDDGWPAALPDGSHALAGGMNGLLGLWDAWRVTGDPAIRNRFDRGASWLAANIDRYDRDFTVLYALEPDADRTSAVLLQYSIDQLQLVAAASGQGSLAATAAAWQWRSDNPGAFRLNLILLALGREPATWVALAGGAILAWPRIRGWRDRRRDDGAKDLAGEP